MVATDNASLRLPLSGRRPGLLQRKCAWGGVTGPIGECDARGKKRESGLLQRSALRSSSSVTPPTEVPLISEPRFNHDFSRIDVLSDSHAAEMAGNPFAWDAGAIERRGNIRLQRKLAVGSANDSFEREADRIADQLAVVPAHSELSSAPLRIQRLSGQSDGMVSAAPPSVDRALASPGRPLDTAFRQDMEQRFGYDFSRVRVHSDAAADQSARDVNARAYAVGHDIVFSAGQFAPGTHEGRRLIGHELTHVVQQSGFNGAIGTRAVSSTIQRAPNQSIDPLTALTGESDIYAAPISGRPVEQMSKSEVDDEISRLDRWIHKQNQSTPDVVKREKRLANLYQRQTELGAPVKAHRATPVVAVKPRCLTESLNIMQMTRDEMAAELDSIVRFLRLGPSKSDIAKVTQFKHVLEQSLEDERERENEEVRRRDIALALQPITTGNTYEDFRKVLTVIASIAPDPNNPTQAALHLPNGMTVPVSNDEAISLKTNAAQMIKKYTAQSESLAEDTYQAFEERRQKGKEHPIVHGMVKWAAGVDDLDELEMFGKKEQARSLRAQIKRLADSGQLIPAFNLSVSLEMWSEGYAQQVGEWEGALMKSAGRWVLGLTVLKEGLTLLATAGAGSLISSARVARGVSALRATAEVATATTFAGTAGAVGGYVTSEKFTGGEVTLHGVVKAGRVGAGTGLAIGAAPGAVAAGKEAFGVGKAATTVGNVARGAAAEVVGSTPVNVVAAGIQGESMKDAAISTFTSSTISGGAGQVVAKIAKGSKVVSTVASAGIGGTAATAGALASGKDTRDTIIAGAFGTAGGALGPHLEESNKNYLEGRSGGSPTEGAPKPLTTDELFDFSDTASPGSGARSEGSPLPAAPGVGGKFDLSDVGGSPPADARNVPKAATTGTTQVQAPAIPAEPAGSQAVPVRSSYTPRSEETFGAGPRRISPVDRGRGARPFYAKDPKTSATSSPKDATSAPAPARSNQAQSSENSPGAPNATEEILPASSGLPGATGTRHLPREFKMPTPNESNFPETSAQAGTPAQRSQDRVRARGERVGPEEVGTKMTEVPGGRTGTREHWNEHGEEFPEYSSARQYKEGAIEFCRAPTTRRFYYRHHGRPTIGYYDPATNTFAATSLNGRTIFTYFRPADVMVYISNIRRGDVPPGTTPRHSTPVRKN